LIAIKNPILLDSNPDPEPENKPHLYPKPEPNPDPEPETKPHLYPKPERDPDPEPENKPHLYPKPEPNPDPEPEPDSTKANPALLMEIMKIECLIL